MSDILQEVTDFLGEAKPGEGDPPNQEVVPEPTPVTASEPVPEPVSEPIPEPVPEPEPVPTPKPTTPVSVPEPIPGGLVPKTPAEELAAYKLQQELLLKRIEDITGRSMTAEEAIQLDVDQPTSSPVTTPVAPAVQPATPVAPAEPPNFLGTYTVDDIMDDPKKFNEVLINVYKKGIDDAKLSTSENTLRSIPQLVTTYIRRYSTMKEMVDGFYKDNPDLLKVRKTVAAVANEVAAEDPGQPVDKVFMKVAERTRTILGLPTPNPGQPITTDTTITPVDPNKPKTPAFATQNARKGTPSSGLKGLAKEVNDLIQ
jgi:hypothetical protein